MKKVRPTISGMPAATDRVFRILFWNLLLSALLSAAGREVSWQAESMYTSLESKDCKVDAPPADEEPSFAICPGVMGYALKTTLVGARKNLAVVDPSGRVHDLDFPGLISAGFSALGPRAEWRMLSTGGARVPAALIVGFTAQAKNGSEAQYLAVSKITPKAICLVAVLPPHSEQHEHAREAADRAATSKCMEPKTH